MLSINRHDVTVPPGRDLLNETTPTFPASVDGMLAYVETCVGNGTLLEQVVRQQREGAEEFGLFELKQALNCLHNALKMIKLGLDEPAESMVQVAVESREGRVSQPRVTKRPTRAKVVTEPTRLSARLASEPSMLAKRTWIDEEPMDCDKQSFKYVYDPREEMRLSSASTAAWTRLGFPSSKASVMTMLGREEKALELKRIPPGLPTFFFSHSSQRLSATSG